MTGPCAYGPNNIRKKWLLGIALLAPFPVGWLIYPVQWSLPLCLWRSWTGHLCPFCGLTRAFAYAAHGEFSQAAHFHPFWWLVAMLFITGAMLNFIDLWQGQNRFERWFHPGHIPPWLILGLLAAATVVRWFYP